MIINGLNSDWYRISTVVLMPEVSILGPLLKGQINVYRIVIKGTGAR